LTRYFARRLAFAAFLVFAVSSASLVLARLGEGDYVSGALGVEARRETMEQLRARYGLDKSIGARSIGTGSDARSDSTSGARCCTTGRFVSSYPNARSTLPSWRSRRSPSPPSLDFLSASSPEAVVRSRRP
jgi:hypothetical protein